MGSQPPLQLSLDLILTENYGQQLVQHAGVARASIAYAGLKDRQAITDQRISIVGRAVELRLPNLRVTPVGRTDKPVQSRMSRGNAFTIVVRDLRPPEAAQLRRNLPSLQKTGFPNYFDDQRFGCVRHGQGFVVREVLRGNYEAALAQLIAVPSPRAITGDVKLKRALEVHWGDWETCLSIARGPVYEPVFRHLRDNPGDFRRALELLPQRQRVIHSFAYQSMIWKRAVSELLYGGLTSAHRLRITTLVGDVMGWKYLEPEREAKLVEMETPLYAPDGNGGSEPFRRAMAKELEHAGHTREDFLRNEVAGMVWREEHRPVLIKPDDLHDVRLEPDERYEGRVKATLSFALPRGAYATMLLKRLFAPSWYARSMGARGEGFGRPSGGRGGSYGSNQHGRGGDRGRDGGRDRRDDSRQGQGGGYRGDRNRDSGHDRRDDSRQGQGDGDRNRDSGHDRRDDSRQGRGDSGRGYGGDRRDDRGRSSRQDSGAGRGDAPSRDRDHTHGSRQGPSEERQGQPRRPTPWQDIEGEGEE